MLAVAGGYVLGRTKKMKFAIMLAGMASGNKIARDPAQLLAQGTRLLQSSPQLSALSDQVRGRLVEAGKGVAVAVVSRQMDSLSDRLSERTERLSGRLPEPSGEGTEQDRAERVTQPGSRRATGTGTGGRRGIANPPRKRGGPSSGTNGSGNTAGSVARSRVAGGGQGGGRHA
jgi:hypothetical protein